MFSLYIGVEKGLSMEFSVPLSETFSLSFPQTPSINLVFHTKHSAGAVELHSTFHSKRAVFYFEVKAGWLINIWSK